MLNKILAGLGIVVTMLFFLGGLSISLAEIWSMPAQKANERYAVDSLDNALLGLHKAQFIQPQSALLYELEGEIYLRKNKKLKLNDTKLWQQAKTSFRHAIEIEPANARLWAKFSASKALLREIDGEFYFSYKKAYEYGGWDYMPNWLLADIGLARWYSIDVETRIMLKEILRRMYVVEPRQTMALADTYGQLHMLCIWTRDLPNQKPACIKSLQ